MANVQELKTVVKETLEKRGVLGQIKARIRAEVFSALDDQHDPRPQLSNENLIINELIREYLEFNKYRYTSSVLMAESGQPRTPLDRQFLMNELNVAEDSASASVPLLYGIISQFLKAKGLKNPDRGVAGPGSLGSLQNDPYRRERYGRSGQDRMELDYGDTDGVEHDPLLVRGGYR